MMTRCLNIGMTSAVDEIIALVSRISGSEKAQFQSRLLQDLSIAGDDASELLAHLHSHFNVSFSGFDFDRYFPEEHEALGDYLRRRLRLLRSDKAPIIVGHLIAVVRRGAWFEPEAV